MARKVEDMLRDAAGMPPRPGSRKAKKETRQNGENDSPFNFSGYYRNRNNRRQTYTSGPIIPKEYAEDVDFVETKDFSQSEIDPSGQSASSRQEWHESQVSDVEWEEIKSKR